MKIEDIKEKISHIERLEAMKKRVSGFFENLRGNSAHDKMFLQDVNIKDDFERIELDFQFTISSKIKQIQEEIEK